MKIRAERAPLADALTWVAQAISKNPARPELSGVRLAASDGLLTLKAFDYDRAHTAVLDVDVASDGECLVSARFLKIISAMKGREVELTLDGNLRVSSGGATYRAQVMEVGNFPDLPTLPAEVGTCDADELAAAIAAVRHPIDDASSFPQVRGLHIEGNHDLELVGMDNFHIAHATVSWQRSGDVDLLATLHSGFLDAAVKGMSGTVTLGASEGLLGVSDGSRAVTARCYADEYTPKWRLFLAPSEDAVVSLDSADLKDALKRVRAFDPESTAVAFGFADDQLTIEGFTEGSDGSELIEAKTEGAAKRGLHPRLLAETLAAVPSGPLTIRAHPKGLWLFEPVDHDHLTFAVMSKPLPQEAR